MTKPDGLDQSWGYADPQQAAAAGIRVVSMYLSHDPSKNVTAAKVRAYHAHGIAVLLNWESQPGRPLLGAQAGRDDATEAVRQADALIRDVGYAPASELAIVFSTDVDTTPAQYSQIDAYYAATKAVLAGRYLNGVYGEADLVEHLHAVGLTVVEWQTYAWSGGRLSPETDFHQYLNGQQFAGASVDFNRVLHAEQLGAWWPIGHRLNSSTPSAVDAARKDSDMILVTVIVDKDNKPIAEANRRTSWMGAGFCTDVTGTAATKLRPVTPEITVNQAEHDIIRAKALSGVIKPDELAAAVANKISPASGGSVTQQQIADALRGVLDGATIEVAK